MIRISDKRKCMAALATFRNMYNKADIYDIIAELARQTIIEKAVTSLPIESFYSLFKDETGIDIPISILESSLKRLNFVSIEKKILTINDKLKIEECEDVKKNINEQEEKNNALLSALKSYVENKLSRTLTLEEYNSLINTLCSHIVDDTYSGPFVEHVCSFILENETNFDFMDYFNHLREGTIIFLGYTYTTHDGYFDKIDKPIKIYCETEILFHMAGYNGKLFKTLFDEFYHLVEAINRKKGKKKVIQLYYFEETEEEINNFFKIACDIVERKQPLDPTKKAMVSICDGCSDAYQIKEKQTEFKKILKEYNIVLDEQNSYYDIGNYKFTIEHEKFIEHEDASVEKINEKLKFLNNINIKRGNRPQKIFRNIGHLLLSGNSLTFRIANDDAIKQNGNLPLAFSLSALTNRFWLVLNKGLIPDMKLSNFNMIAKSRIALAYKVNITISNIFKELENEIETGKISIEDAKENLLELRSDCINPDKININELDKCLTIISNGDLELYISVKENEKRKFEQLIAEADQKAKLAETGLKKISEINNKAVNAIFVERNNTFKSNYEKEIEQYEKDKETCIDKQYAKYRKEQYTRFTLYVVFYLILFSLFFIFTNNKIKGIFGIIGGVIIQTIWYFIPFLRAIESFDNLKKANKFLFCRKEREAVRANLGREYENLNPKPIIKNITKDDIVKELESVE